MSKQIVFLFLVATLSVLHVSWKTDITKTKQEFLMNDTIKKTIEKWQKLTNISLAGMIKKEASIEKNVAYEKITKVTRATLSKHPKFYFYYNSTGKCLMLYINQAALSNLTTNSLEKAFNTPNAVERSRGGKRANHYIYSTKGFAFSELDDKVLFFEVFPECSLSDYKANIYIEPPVFTH